MVLVSPVTGVARVGVRAVPKAKALLQPRRVQQQRRQQQQRLHLHLRGGGVAPLSAGLSAAATGADTAAAAAAPAAPPARRALLFDMDGTLTESEALHCIATGAFLAPALRATGVEYSAEYFRTHISGHFTRTVFREHLDPARYSDAQIDALVWQREKRVCDEAAATGLALLPGVWEFLREARARGIATALVTNAPRRTALFLLRHFGLMARSSRLFDAVVSGDDCARPKPAPDPYLRALELLRVVAPENALVFEDTPAGVAAGAAARVGGVVGVCAGASPHPADTLVRAGASIVISSYVGLTVQGLDEALERARSGGGGGSSSSSSGSSTVDGPPEPKEGGNGGRSSRDAGADAGAGTGSGAGALVPDADSVKDLRRVTVGLPKVSV